MPDLGSLGAVLGTVVDENKAPMQYAAIYVMNPKDSTTVTGGITDENGRILIKDIPWGTYFLQVNAMGYSKHFTSEFTLTQANPRYMLRQFAITQRPEQLKGVEITVQKEMLQQNLDKKVYNLESSIVTEGATAVEALAVSVLQNKILSPVLNIHDPRSDKRIDFVGGARGTAGLTARVDSGEMAAAFTVSPTKMTELLDVADSGRVMPPKSTWFEPKLKSGLLIHEF